MNSILLKIIVLVIVSTAIFYIAFAVLFAEFNIFHWSENARGGFLTVLMLAYVFGSLIIAIDQGEKEKKLEKENVF